MENDIRKKIGAELRNIREAQHLTVRELAERCNIDHSHIVRIESGRYGVSLDTLHKISKALNAEISIITTKP